MHAAHNASMDQAGIAAEPRAASLTLGWLALVGTPIVFAAYAIVIRVVRNLPLAITLAGSAANTLPTVLLGLAAYWMVGRALVGRRLIIQTIGHVAFGAIYALLTYWLLIILLGVVNSASLLQFNVESFPNGASMWQLLQNATTYGLVATLAYAQRPSGPITVVFDTAAAEPAGGLTRYFIRSGDDIHPVAVDAIVSIAGADDYTEVRTLAASHLVRLTLAEFEKSLDPMRFIRVHRSRIVNVERIVRAEPAGGGRLLLHMENGETIAASRSGSKLLKDRVL